MKLRTLISIAIIGIAVSTAAAKDKHAPLSPKIMLAKSVYIKNTGESAIADKAYTALTKWGRFQIVESPEKADITMIFSTSETPSTTARTSHYNQDTGQWSYGTANVSGSGFTHLDIVDAKTGESLYSDVRQWRGFSSATKHIISGLEKRMEEQEKR